MDRASEGTRARRNATFKESTAPSRSSPVWLLRYIPGIVSVQCLLNLISPHARKAGTEPQGPSVAPLTSASPHWRRPGFPNKQALHCPCPSHHLWLHIRSDWGSGYSQT